jgi:hypothetical protein
MTSEGLLSFGVGIIEVRRLWYKSAAAAKPVAGGIGHSQGERSDRGDLFRKIA